MQTNLCEVLGTLNNSMLVKEIIRIGKMGELGWPSSRKADAFPFPLPLRFVSFHCRFHFRFRFHFCFLCASGGRRTKEISNTRGWRKFGFQGENCPPHLVFPAPKRRSEEKPEICTCIVWSHEQKHNCAENNNKSGEGTVTVLRNGTIFPVFRGWKAESKSELSGSANREAFQVHSSLISHFSIIEFAQKHTFQAIFLAKRAVSIFFAVHTRLYLIAHGTYPI